MRDLRMLSIAKPTGDWTKLRIAIRHAAAVIAADFLLPVTAWEMVGASSVILAVKWLCDLARIP